MNAQEALKLSQENWSENEQKNLSHIVGFQNKVETAAKEGRVQCTIATIPPHAVDFTAAFFEQMGYFVLFSGTAVPNEVSVALNWKQEPLGSRLYKDAQEFSTWMKQ